MMIFKRYTSISILYRGARHMQIQSRDKPEHNNNVNCLCNYLNISESKAQHLSKKHPVITKLNEERIKSLVSALKDIGYSDKVLLEEPGLFGVLPITLKFRYKVLKECGIKNVSPALLSTYLTVIRQKTIEELKASREIPIHVNVENRLASYLTQWPTSLTSLIYEDVNKSTLFTVRLKIIQRYLELVLDLTSEEFYRGVETYPTVKHRPLEYINETLKILQSSIMMPNHKIKSNLYLLHADPENLKNIIFNFRTIGGIDVKEVIRMHPKIAIKNVQTLLDIRKILEAYNISNEAQRRCFDIYTLGPETIKERLENAKSTPEFSMFYNHPRFLKMIHYNKTALKRLSQSYEKNKKCLSLNILSGSSAHYDVFEKAPGDRLGKGKDLLFCITQSLGKKFTTSQVRNMIKRHPFWINIPVLQAKYIYDKLSLKYTDDEIFENCPILLYPWKKVSSTLNLLQKKCPQEHFTIFHEDFKFDALSNSQKLSLVLYILETKHYFSGNGVWTEERNMTLDNVPPCDLETTNINK
ncbi:transcription termination factor 5, mitochondrial-like [Anticarsia gemmatalis]|uniref:transcription termination factor 5, mitochondrial-like n=1 Tax=Anticarsia gemmatalis TaxID=129554 RepID=UPI003F763EDB